VAAASSIALRDMAAVCSMWLTTLVLEAADSMVSSAVLNVLACALMGEWTASPVNSTTAALMARKARWTVCLVT
jgi:hypothetical protein|tara:strand:- start:334 stop:555 length:222 start_codon:yes stop_codon:yes gene_type:complete